MRGFHYSDHTICETFYCNETYNIGLVTVITSIPELSASAEMFV